jgi:hypothetical protein
VKLNRRKRQNKQSFWLTNISKKIVSLTDLGICIYPMRSINALDARHYSLTLEQLQVSATSGSIFKKRDKIVVRKVIPEDAINYSPPIQEDAVFPTRARSLVDVEKVEYEELDIKDEEFAEENADTAELDHIGKYKGQQ